MYLRRRPTYTERTAGFGRGFCPHQCSCTGHPTPNTVKECHKSDNHKETNTSKMPNCIFNARQSQSFWITLLLTSVILPCTLAQSAPDMYYAPAEFLTQPLPGSAEVQGNTKVLLCSATGVPTPVYTWYKDGSVIEESINQTDTNYRIRNIERDDAGQYQCVASNTYGSAFSNRVFITVAYMVPFSTSGDEAVRVDQGKAYKVDLPLIHSFPEPSIIWYELIDQAGGASPTKRPILNEAQRYQITLKNQLVRLETRLSDDNKHFKARATNSYTGQISESQKFVLKVQDIGSQSNNILPQIIIAPEPTSAVQGEDNSAHFECVVNARPIQYLSIIWYRKKEDDTRERILSNNKYILSQYSRRLTIKTPQIPDTGVYECEADFSRAEEHDPVRAEATLTVYVKPTFRTQPPANIKQDYGTTAEISCSAEGTPTPTVRWYRNTVPLTNINDGRFEVLPSGTLKITDIRTSDSGIFQCFASNTAGEVNGHTWLQVLSSPPKIEERPQNASVIAGDSARLACVVTGAPKPSIRWYRVTKQGSEDLVGDSGRIQVQDRELQILNTQVEDSGKYVCNATNNKGNDHATAYLTVRLRTRITSPPQDASVIKGSRHTILCGVTHDSQVDVTWVWYHNSKVIPSNDVRRTIRSDGSLELQAVRNEDIGMYRCEVTSTAGDDIGSANLEVIELPYPPSIMSVTLNSKSNKAVDVAWSPGFDGNSPLKTFVVQYRLVPEGSQLLLNEGWQTASDEVLHDERLYTVTNLQPARSYQFRVSAVNDVGEGPASAPSDLIEMPQQPPSGPPRGVVGSPRSEMSIIIQWQPPDEDKWNGPLTGYMIRYKPSGYPDSTLTYENVTNYLVLAQELVGLIVFTEYEIAVAAYNKKGVGVYSDMVRIRTLEGKPTQPPRDVLGEAVSSTSVKISWLPPDPQYINGINQGYKVEARRPNVAEPEVSVTVPSDITNMLGTQNAFLNHLKKFTEYQVSVLCYTSKGDGPESQPISVKTMEDVPDMVGSLSFSHILDTSLHVMWTPPPNINGILVGYTLSYMKKNQTITKVTKPFGSLTLNYTVTGLTATTTYTIEVFARSRVGAGPPRAADIESGIPPVQPEPPRNLAITNIQATSVLLQFVPGFNGYTSISKWIIEAQVNGATEWQVIFEKAAPDANSITVENLTPYTQYRLRLMAKNVADQSKPSEPTRTFQTIQAPPSSPPPEVTVRAVNETAIRVRWKPLASDLWNGEGRGYMIQYKTTDEVFFYRTIEVDDENANSYTFSGLEEWMAYDVRVASFNKVGNSAYSPTATDRTFESVPSAGPGQINATSQSSTSIMVSWSEVQANQQNGHILGYKVHYSPLDGTDEQMKVMNRSDVRQLMLSDLRKYTRYRIQVLAYTRIGDGVLSQGVVVRTFEDVPGAPAGIYFPEVTHSTARVVWSSPTAPNGNILGYQVAYREKSKPVSYTIVDDTLGSTVREYYVANLQRTTYYVFSISAKTVLGWGEPGVVEVYTIVNRRVPDAPSQPQIGMSQVEARWVIINWQPGSNGYGPIRNYIIQVQMEGAPYQTIPDYVRANLTSYKITDLTPNTRYRFRISAINDLGESPFSIPSEEITTKQAAPDSPPGDVEVVPKTTRTVLVSWKPPAVESWNGNQLGYQVWFSQLEHVTSESSYQQVTVAYPTTSVELPPMQANVYYEVKVNAFNSKGHGPFSRPYDVYVGEAVPTEFPKDFIAETASATEIRVMWSPPSKDSWNGDLLGYKIFYWVESEGEIKSQVKTVAATETEAILEMLNMYTQYTMVMLAFNAAGDGPNTTIQITATTHEGLPSKPGPLLIVMTSMTALNVSWPAPAEANGIIIQYEVSYYQDSDIDGESRSVQVRLGGDKHSYLASPLVENVKYVFSVKARTSQGWGAQRYGNITTGPQPGSPMKPGQPDLSAGATSVTIKWINGYVGEGPITGYIIQGKEKGWEVWETLMLKNTPEPEAFISFYNLKPNAEYQFRVIAINKKGISAPSEASDYLQTLGIDKKPFYRQWWFSVIIALLGLIFVIIVTSLLCMTHRNRPKQYKTDHIPKTTIHLQEPSIAEEDNGFSTFEMRQSQRRSQRKPPKPNGTLPPYTRSPPRPSPGSVNYSDEETKYPDEESSSLTDKPSDLSSSGSESAEPSDSEPESEKVIPPAFTNHYVNGDVQQSWRRHQDTPSTMYNYTDSEADSSQYAVTMNGGHIIMNNMAGSRAPLPGFSSFV